MATNDIQQLVDIPYDLPSTSPSCALHPQRTLDLYFSLSILSPVDLSSSSSDTLSSAWLSCPDACLILFVHGGAWRAGDKSVHESLARQWASLHPPARSRGSERPKNIVVAVPNYRLSPAVKHPVHTEDTYDALEFLLSGHERKEGMMPDFVFEEVWIVGHSAGAHIACSLVLSPPPTAPLATGSHTTPASPVSRPRDPKILHRITGVIGLEGIYDLDVLLHSFPSAYYRTFIEQGFGPPIPPPPSPRNPNPIASYQSVSTTHFTLPPPVEVAGWLETPASHIRFALLHSPDDTLVDALQARLMSSHLLALYKDIDSPEALWYRRREALKLVYFHPKEILFLSDPVNERRKDAIVVTPVPDLFPAMSVQPNPSPPIPGATTVTTREGPFPDPMAPMKEEGTRELGPDERQWEARGLPRVLVELERVGGEHDELLDGEELKRWIGDVLWARI